MDKHEFLEIIADGKVGKVLANSAKTAIKIGDEDFFIIELGEQLLSEGSSEVTKSLLGKELLEDFEEIHKEVLENNTTHDPARGLVGKLEGVINGLEQGIQSREKEKATFEQQIQKNRDDIKHIKSVISMLGSADEQTVHICRNLVSAFE